MNIELTNFSYIICLFTNSIFRLTSKTYTRSQRGRHFIASMRFWLGIHYRLSRLIRHDKHFFFFVNYKSDNSNKLLKNSSIIAAFQYNWLNSIVNGCHPFIPKSVFSTFYSIAFRIHRNYAEYSVFFIWICILWIR